MTRAIVRELYARGGNIDRADFARIAELLIAYVRRCKCNKHRRACSFCACAFDALGVPHHVTTGGHVRMEWGALDVALQARS